MTVTEIKLADCKPFAENPFRVEDGDEMEMLKESILHSGILNPIVVRPAGDGKYEIISGHRRVFACLALGISSVPAIVKEFSREEAIIAMVDSNLQRDGLRPSEKAFAYKMKLDAMKHQGKSTCAQLGHKSRDVLAKDSGISRETVRRYIRLTYLAKPLLDLVDEKKIALTPAVELSYLAPDEQAMILDAMEYYDCTPSYSQTVRFHRLSEQGELDCDTVYDILAEEKANQRERISFETASIRKFFPSSYTAKDMENAIVRLLEKEKRRNSRDER